MPDTPLIVGLGNPGRRYAHTRHNVGFMVVDELASRARRRRAAFRAGGADYLLCRSPLAGSEVLLVKPLTFMNLSGIAVQQALDNFKLTAASLLIVFDDCSLPFGRLRFRPQGSDGGHHGMASVIATLGTRDIARLRIGIGSDFLKGAQVDYVLSPFAAHERKELKGIIDRASDAVLVYLAQGIEAAMSRCN